MELAKFMLTRMPVVFVSHGAPDALLKAPDTVACWREIGTLVPEPKEILVVSAHWEASEPTVSLATAPATIHDFSGFSPELYQMQYPAPGAPDLAKRTMSLFASAGIAAAEHPNRGIDHGAWVPLSAMFPQAQVPVMQLSLTRQMAAAHFAIGKVLSSLRDEGVLIVASGAITHNFAWFGWHASTVLPPLPKALAFADWVGEHITAQDFSSLMDYRAGPYGTEAHPTEEHILPLLVALGAAGTDPSKQYRPAFTYGGLSMDAYCWGLQDQRQMSA